jgi:hypothetical protein
MSDVGLEVVQNVYREMQIDPEWSQQEDRGFVWWGHRAILPATNRNGLERNQTGL